MTEINSNAAGSSSQNEPAYLLIGKLQKTHGIKGEITMRVITHYPERIRPGKTVFLGEENREYSISSLRWKNALMLIIFEGIETSEEAAQLTNLEVFSTTRRLPKLPEGQYYHHQLLGLKVWQGDEFLGELTEIMETGANDVYVVEAEGTPELLIPAISDVIKEIDLEVGTMQVQLLEGLRD
ncbi:MAG: ribosome maturation factor RimM [Anaerolineaceae bacterium]|nr:ribosome maturation factor RimM [Anaerolineaceae bacterium]MDD4042131.1 ribosome maturation factor RimM [Anaerolineaceae bacterium]MDD4578585.1 ribosome maturation factor RimM [Anaerolineaceae bacterium]